MDTNTKNVAPSTTIATTTSEDKNAKLELAKVRKQIRTGVQAGGWRCQDS